MLHVQEPKRRITFLTRPFLNFSMFVLNVDVCYSHSRLCLRLSFKRSFLCGWPHFCFCSVWNNYVVHSMIQIRSLHLFIYPSDHLLAVEQAVQTMQTYYDLDVTVGRILCGFVTTSDHFLSIRIEILINAALILFDMVKSAFSTIFLLSVWHRRPGVERGRIHCSCRGRFWIWFGAWWLMTVVNKQLYLTWSSPAST